MPQYERFDFSIINYRYRGGTPPDLENAISKLGGPGQSNSEGETPARAEKARGLESSFFTNNCVKSPTAMAGGQFSVKKRQTGKVVLLWKPKAANRKTLAGVDVGAAFFERSLIGRARMNFFDEGLEARTAFESAGAVRAGFERKAHHHVGS